MSTLSQERPRRGSQTTQEALPGELEKSSLNKGDPWQAWPVGERSLDASEAPGIFYLFSPLLRTGALPGTTWQESSTKFSG
jgi:hypothetical protein